MALIDPMFLLLLAMIWQILIKNINWHLFLYKKRSKKLKYVIKFGSQSLKINDQIVEKPNVGQKLPYLVAIILTNVQPQKNMINISSNETWVLLLKGNQKILTITNLIFTVNCSLKKRGQAVLTQQYWQLFVPKFFI